MNFTQVLTHSVVFILQLQLLLLKSRQICGNPLRKSTKLNTMPSSKVQFHPNSKQVKLSTKARLFVKIARDGGISATANCSDNGTILELSTVGSSSITIKGVQSGLYIAMNSNGKIYTRTTPNDEAVFKNVQMANLWYNYASCKYYMVSYYDAFIAFNDHGKVKRAQKTKVTHRSTHFLELKVNACS